MIVYELYWTDTAGDDHLIGILPERRRDPERITEESILNWGRMAVCEFRGIQEIYFIPFEVFDPPPIATA